MESARSTMLALSLIAGALIVAILQVSWVAVAERPAIVQEKNVKFRFPTDKPEGKLNRRETYAAPRPAYTRS